jgi:hypothetical protein
MKTFITGLLMAGLLVGPLQARTLPYQQDAAPASDSGGGHSTNVLPLVAIAGAVITTGYVLFKVHKVKQARAARFSVYVMAKGGK